MTKKEEILGIINRAIDCIDFDKIPDKNVNLEEQCTPHIRSITINEYGIGPDIIVDGVSVLDLSIEFLCNRLVTIPNLKVGVFHQLQSNSELALQKVLRMCNYKDGEKATIYILAYEGTNDEKWVNKAIRMLDPDKIEYLHYKNIK